MRQRLVVVRDRLGPDRDPELLGELARRKLPQSAEQTAGAPAREHDAARVADPHQGAIENRQLVAPLASRRHRKFVNPIAARRDATRDQWAGRAARRGRRAQRRAELDQALVEITGIRGLGKRGHQLPGVSPRRVRARCGLDVVVDRVEPSQHARDVAVDDRRAFAERDRRDRTGGVAADPGYRAKLRRGPRQVADRARAVPQVARSRVVAEPAPRREHVVERGTGKRRCGRELRHPPVPVRDDGRDPGLLQHDLADPDRVRIACSPPRQIAFCRRVVRDHGGRDRAAQHARW